jgi:uncharacterized coiled-coil protein SlyX
MRCIVTCVVVGILGLSVGAWAVLAGAESPGKRLRALEQRVTDLEDRVAGVEGTVQQSQDDITALQDDVADLQATSATKDEVMDLDDRVTALQGRVDALEQAANGLAVYDANAHKVGNVLGINFSGWGESGVGQVFLAFKVDQHTFVLGLTREHFLGVWHWYQRCNWKGWCGFCVHRLFRDAVCSRYDNNGQYERLPHYPGRRPREYRLHAGAWSRFPTADMAVCTHRG